MEAGKARERHKQTTEAAANRGAVLEAHSRPQESGLDVQRISGTLVARARDDAVAIDTVDVRGIQGREEQMLPGEYSDPIVDGMMYAAKALAAQTGGLAFYGANNLGLGLQQALVDSEAAYLLGYYPSHQNWDGGYHRIAVTVNRPETNVRHRRGYFANPDSPEPPVRDRRQAAQALVMAPDDESAIALHVKIGPLQSGAHRIGVFIDPRASRAVWRASLSTLRRRRTAT